MLAVLLACVGATVSLALLAAHQDATIDHLRTALRNASRPAPAAAALPAVSGSAMFSLPGAAGGSFSVVAVAVRPEPGSAALTWLFVYGRHANPGQRYGLLSDTCGGQYVAEYDDPPRTTWRKVPRTGTVTSRSWRPIWISTPGHPVSGSRCTGWQTAHRWAASRAR